MSRSRAARPGELDTAPAETLTYTAMRRDGAANEGSLRPDPGNLAVPPSFISQHCAPSGERAAPAMRGSRPREFRRMQLLLWSADALVASAGTLAAWLWGHPALMLLPVAWVAMMAIRTTRDGRIADLSDMRPYAKVNANFVLVMTLCAIIFNDLSGTRTVLGISTGMAVLGYAARGLLGLPRFRERAGLDAGESVVVVGNLESVSRTIGEWGGLSHVTVIGVCLSEADVGPESVHDVPVLGSVADVASLTRRMKIDVVAIHDVDQLGGLQLAKLQWALEDVGTQMSIITPMTNTVVGRARVRRVGRRLIVDVAYSRPQGMVAVLKGLVDRAVGLFAFAAALPVILVCAAFIKATSPGPVIFRQTRVREHERVFTMYKLRTMAVDAEDRFDELAALNEVVGGGIFKMKADPRITRAGKWMRRLSLDELPQLWNVVIGDMSLIGPRPALPHEVASYDQAARRRLVVKPGLTGLWQVSGRSNLSWDESVRIDSDYVDNWRPGRDLSIALRTVKAVLSKNGAH